MTLECERLKLILLDARQLRLFTEDMAALECELHITYRAEPLEGEFLRIVRGQLEITEKDPENAAWHSFFLIMRRSDGAVVGSLDFKDVPNEAGEVETGYGLAKEYEHMGYMTEALMAACRFALGEDGVKSVTAETERDNHASQRVLARCGFTEYEKGGENKWFILRGTD